MPPEITACRLKSVNMSTKIKRKVTVENSKDDNDHPRRPSVFERLGPGAVNIATQPTDRHSRPEHNEKCRNWLRTGNCAYGNTCRYKHDTFPSSSRRSAKSEKEVESKDLRHKVKTKRDEPKESRDSSMSPKRKSSKRSMSRSRKGEHESKIKSTVVVTRPRSPSSATAETETKKKTDGNWEDDSDDWPMDAAQLDYKEELTLERKRQQLQRELELELQKERLLNESVTITKTVSFSESSSTSSSSDSGTISSSSESTSSSSDEDSNDSSSTSSSSSSSSSRPPTKKKNKKSFSKDSSRSLKSKGKDDYDKIKSSRAAKVKKNRSPSPILESRKGRKGRDKHNLSPSSPRKRHPDGRSDSVGRSNINVRLRGPRTPSPSSKPRKQRQWAQSSSADSLTGEVQRNKGKRHKKKKDLPRNEKRKSDRVLSPPPLSSPNRQALIPIISSKKTKPRIEVPGKTRHRTRDASPPIIPRNSGSSSQSMKLMGTSRYLTDEKPMEKLRGDERSKYYSRKEEEDLLPPNKRNDSRDRGSKRSKLSPRKDSRRGSLSPHKDRYDSEMLSVGNRKLYPHEKDKLDRRRPSVSPVRSDRRKMNPEIEKKRDVRELSPREHESRRDNAYRGNEPHGYDKRGNEPKKRFVSPDMKKNRDDKGRDHIKDRNSEYDSSSWQGDHRKPVSSSTDRRTPEPRGRQEMRSQPSLSRNDRSHEREADRKKIGKKRDLSVRSVESDRSRLPSPRRSQSPVHGHHGVREIESLTGNRGRMYESDIPPGEREYGYGYDSLHDPYLSDRLLPSDYESDVLRGSSVYPSDVYPESRYRRGGKDSLDRYEPRDVMSPRDVLPHRDIISLTGRGDDYLSDLPMDERSYDDRWQRGRGRDDWDPYATLPPAPLPPHVAAALDEDRYGMPRRRRASPDWQRGRMDDRDPSSGHRPGGRVPGPLSEGRSRSPKGPGSNRSSWSDRGGRHDSRSTDGKPYDDPQKDRSLDDRKGRNIRKDRGKPLKDESLIEDKGFSSKEKAPVKRPHSPSPSPPSKIKKRRNDMPSFESRYHGSETSEKVSSGSAKKGKEEIKPDSKQGANNRIQKSGKQDISSPKIDNLSAAEKGELPSKSATESKPKEKEERKSRKNDDGARGEDDFSDWSDDDDDLLTREDFVESEANNENVKYRHKSDEITEDNARRRDRHTRDDLKKDRDDSRTSSRDRSIDDTSHVKDSKLTSEGKDIDIQESLSLKEDTATDVDEYVTAESVDYDPISDDELDALIEEPDETLIKPAVEEKSKIVNALEVDWSTLMNETKTEFVPGFARQRFKAAHVLSRIGFSQVFAGSELTEKIIETCQKQLDEEVSNEEDETASKEENKNAKKFVMEHPLAAFHVAISQNKLERTSLFNKVGPYRRALCARRDLQIRKVLCRPLNKLDAASAVTYTSQYTVVDKELYKQSLELLKLKKPPEVQPQTIVC
ncbi:zinc finger CCCH domain-containing protein 13 [Nephila pilipes]|uniref:Zinc finger CCCH domain-containing protein 13 n=1 Tax=Nephila pilipes TaxID=299642 RepID=A0A8X6JVA7_NEPPI|nr:zinc finger CCCH domain-containing protein 13 [Nephila pilipes]